MTTPHTPRVRKLRADSVTSRGFANFCNDHYGKVGGADYMDHLFASGSSNAEIARAVGRDRENIRILRPHWEIYNPLAAAKVAARKLAA